MTTDPIEQIRDLSKRLVEIAPWWAGWWAPLSEYRVSGFERDHGIALPEGYRRLLTEFGDRAPIPGRPRGGLLPLEQSLAGTTADEFLGPLDRDFPGAGNEPIELEWDEDQDDTSLAGALPVLDDGCDSTHLLIVTGPDRGRVWSFSPSGAPQLQPTGAEFLDWYVGELERGLAPLETEARAREMLQQRVADNPDELAASVTLGRQLLLTDRSRARELLERAWGAIDTFDATTQTELRRAIAELDLLDGRRDRIEAMAELADDWLRTYAGIAAARAGEHERAIALLGHTRIPVLLRSAAVGQLATALAERGDANAALGYLRATQASASNHAIAARLRTSLGQRDAALRSWREALAAQDRSRTGPRPPRLSDFIEIPVPTAAEIEAEIRTLER